MDYRYLTSSDALRYEKQKALDEINRSVSVLNARVRHRFFPGESYLNAGNKYIRYIGYGIMAFKVANTVRNIVGFFSKRKRY